MKINSHAHHPAVNAGNDVPIERVAQDSHLSQEEKVGQLSGQFEALLLRQILQNARKPVIHSKFNAESAPGAIYDDMVTNQLAQSISHTGALGLAETLQEQLSRQLLHPKTAPEGGSTAH